MAEIKELHATPLNAVKLLADLSSISNFEQRNKAREFTSLHKNAPVANLCESIQATHDLREPFVMSFLWCVILAALF